MSVGQLLRRARALSRPMVDPGAVAQKAIDAMTSGECRVELCRLYGIQIGINDAVPDEVWAWADDLEGEQAEPAGRKP
jgi:hypothetical protein